MENGETTVQGAAREAFEEATAQCDNLRLFGVYNLPRISQVYLLFYGRLRDGYARSGDETLEVGLFDESEIPWDELAFPIVTEALMRYFERHEQREQQVYCADILSRPGQTLHVVRHPS